MLKVTLEQATPNAIDFIAKIASICYDSAPKSSIGLVKHLYRNGHHSVFEHVYFTFKIEGISRACSHQLVRHRHASFTQRSQRYCSEDGFDTVLPDTVCLDAEAEDAYGALMDTIAECYGKLQKLGVPNEDARFVLPNACETELYMSFNLRELIHMSNERLCARAQWEIRELVKQMVRLVPEELHFMLVPKCQSGRIICNSPCKKGGAAK